MRTKALINHFHDLQPIYSAHFEPGSKGRLATAGGDNNVRVCPLFLVLYLLTPVLYCLSGPYLSMADSIPADMANTRFT
jgi:hypothetical protein